MKAARSAVLAWFSALTFATWGWSATAAEPAAGTDPAAEADKAIRGTADAFVRAYNAADADAIAQLFAPDGQIADEHGNAAWGRKAIANVFRQVFQNHPQSRIENSIQSIRLATPGQAVEEGTATVTHAPGEPVRQSRYEVIHVQREGRWLMASAVDLPEAAWAGAEQLKQLEWLIGEWVNENRDALIVTTYRWTENHRYIVNDYQVQVQGHGLLRGSEWIGWDPLRKQIHSWVFDSEGGVTEGLWSQKDQTWVVQMNGFTAQGKPASSRNTFTPQGKDHLGWQSHDRVIGGEKLPDIESVIVVRRPPPPQ